MGIHAKVHAFIHYRKGVDPAKESADTLPPRGPPRLRRNNKSDRLQDLDTSLQGMMHAFQELQSEVRSELNSEDKKISVDGTVITSIEMGSTANEVDVCVGKFT